MYDCQKVCEEIIEAAGKATARPWDRRGPEKFTHGQTIWSGETRLFGNQHECTEADFDLVIVAANNAARLAQMLLTLEDDPGLSIEYLWEQSE